MLLTLYFFRGNVLYFVKHFCNEGGILSDTDIFKVTQHR